MNIATPLIPILNRNDQSREYYYGVEGTFQTGYYDEQSRKLSFWYILDFLLLLLNLQICETTLRVLFKVLQYYTSLAISGSRPA